jgi:superkiller protein 3
MSDARALQREAFQALASGRLPEAIDLYRRALALDPKLAIAWNGLSRALLQHGDLAGATEAGKRLVELEPDEPLNHTNLSILYQSQGLIPEAEEEKAIAMQLELKHSATR